MLSLSLSLSLSLPGCGVVTSCLGRFPWGRGEGGGLSSLCRETERSASLLPSSLSSFLLPPPPVSHAPPWEHDTLFLLLLPPPHLSLCPINQPPSSPRSLLPQEGAGRGGMALSPKRDMRKKKKRRREAEPCGLHYHTQKSDHEGLMIMLLP